MNGNMILDAMEYVGDDLIDEYFCLRSKYEKEKKQRWSKRHWATLVAACLAVVVVGTYAVQYIPKKYDLDYMLQTEYDEMARGAPLSENKWIYYINDYGLMRRERVYFENPVLANIFITWKHLNGIGDDVKLLSSKTISNRIDPAEYGGAIGQYPPDCFISIVSISKSIKKYDNWERMVDSLRKTLLKDCDSCQIVLQ